MKRAEARRTIEARLDSMGIPKHLRGLRVVPSAIECMIAVGARHLQITARAGITSQELEVQLARLEALWALHLNQVDLEEAIEEKEAAQ